MKHFKAEEFFDGMENWFDRCDYNLLQSLDEFRELWGAAVYISRAAGAIGRHDGPDVKSYHNVDYWGMVKAVDVMPEGMDTKCEADRAIRLASQSGFAGIGLYPHWHPRPGLHLDVRDRLARWGGVNERLRTQVYVTLDNALSVMPGGANG